MHVTIDTMLSMPCRKWEIPCEVVVRISVKVSSHIAPGCNGREELGDIFLSFILHSSTSPSVHDLQWKMVADPAGLETAILHKSPDVLHRSAMVTPSQSHARLSHAIQR